MSRGLRGWILALGCVLLASAAVADDWGWPEPASFHARGFGFVAEIFPPGSRQNQGGDRAFCYFYEVGYPGTRWDVHAKLLWKAPVVNGRMPVEGLVSMDGRLVTLNEWGAVGHAHAIVVYDRRGQLVADIQGDKVVAALGPEGKAHLRPSESSLWWNQDAKYYFSRDGSSPGSYRQGARLYVRLNWPRVVVVNLETGELKGGAPAEFPELTVIAADTNAATAVWKTSLRFSSAPI